MKTKLIKMILLVTILMLLFTGCFDEKDIVTEANDIENEAVVKTADLNDSDDASESTLTTVSTKSDDDTNEITSTSVVETTNEEIGVEDYLMNNYQSLYLDDNDEFEDLKILDEDLQDNEIFFTGEMHGIEMNTTLRMTFLKYFKEKVDFKYYLCELSPAGAYYLNNYLETGEQEILEQFFEPLRGTMSWNHDSFNHWIEVYEYNKTLPNDKKIIVVGVDVEHQVDTAFNALVDLLPDATAPNEIKAVLSGLTETSTHLINASYETSSDFKIARDEAYRFSQTLKEAIGEHEMLFKEYFGENFNLFELINDNVLNSKVVYENIQNSSFNNVRDKYIFENFLVVDKELPDGKYYGQWGMHHTIQHIEKGTLWFAGWLNSDKSSYKGQVLTIIYNYENCTRMSREAGGVYATAETNYVFPFLEDVNELIGDNVNIYKLDGENSPIKKEPMYQSFTGAELGSKYYKLSDDVLDFFQYIVLVKDSAATKPLDQ